MHMFNKICIRADGTPQIGTGHIMRCLSLADALKEQGDSSLFVLAEPHMASLIQERGYECRVLGTAYDHMEAELPAFLPILEELRPSCVLLDSYFVTPDYLSAVRAKAPLIYMDDLNAFDYPADVVVNYNLYGLDLPYPPDKRYLLGPRYAPLRRQFQGLSPRRPGERVEGILFSTGGADPYHIARRCVERLLERPPSPGTVCHMVLGAMNRDAEAIQKLAVGAPYIALHRQVTDMRRLMLQCGAAVSAAGTTLYELCACGLPTVTYVLADNQLQGAGAFEAAGLMPCAGDVREDERFIEKLFAALEALTGDWPLRRRTSERMQTLVDGNGAPRLTEAILEWLG